MEKTLCCFVTNVIISTFISFDLFNRSLRRKCSELENHANELLQANRQKSAEISKREESQSKDGELNVSKMKKEMLKVESLQMRLEDYRLKIESLTSEKAYLEEDLLHAKEDAKSVIHYRVIVITE